MSLQILFNWCSLKFIEMQLKIFLRLQIYNKKDKVLFETGLSDLLKGKKNVVKGLSSINLPMTKKKFTVLRSPHVNKKAKDQFEIRMYNTLYVLSLEDNDFFFLQLLKRYCNQAKNISLKMKSCVMGEKRKKKSSTLDRTSKQTISLKNV